MKINTKFDVGDTVTTIVSERRGIIIEILIAKRFYTGWRLQEYSEPQVRYKVEIYFPHRDSRCDSEMFGYFRDVELTRLS